MSLVDTFLQVDGLDKLDYHYYLPVFCDGIREDREPHCAIALMGVYDLLACGQQKVLPVIPQLILPLKSKWCKCSCQNFRDWHHGNLFGSKIIKKNDYKTHHLPWAIKQNFILLFMITKIL